ncbi:MAG: ABC transporter substrate-binding protein, partial [Clostridia bacterium]|nr:ABC transporter substrate-binding protein [Clostridia bacterium]
QGNRISISILPDHVSYFYDIARLNMVPYPITVIAPYCEVRDDGEGVYIAAAAEAADMDAAALGYTPGAFTADMLRVTLLDPATGYVFNPKVTCGPYSLESYDPQTHTARFIVNENYAGNHEGFKPRVERVVFRSVQEDTMIGELSEGAVDVLIRVTSPALAAEAAELGFRSSQYWRTGFAMLSFACEAGPTSSAAVRRAIARCVDKDELIRLGLDGTEYALPVYGYYGRGQWMVNQIFPADEELDIPELDVPAELERFAEITDLEEAKRLLASDGWTLNQAGEAYRDGDGIRHRVADGVLEPLVIRWAKPTDYPMADVLQGMLEAAFAETGIGLEAAELPFDEMLLNHYFRMGERAYDMFLLANNFYYLFDPYFDFHTGDEYQGTVNVSGLRDEQLMNLGFELTQTAPGDMRAYVEKWLVFQERWVELMPMVPLYSNRYYDFRADNVQGYYVNEQSSWVQTLPEVYIGEEEETDDFGLAY